MGMCSFILETEAYTPNEAYQDLVKNAMDEYGSDPYNGTISTTDSLRFHGANHNAFNKKALNQAYDTAKRNDYGDKYIADCIDCGVTKYVLRSVSRAATHKESPKYGTFYDCLIDGEHGTVNLSSFDSKEKADRFMKNFLLERRNFQYGGDRPRVVKVRKVISGTSTVTDFNVTEKSYKSKPHTKSMDGKKLLEVHRYLFYGWAAE